MIELFRPYTTYILFTVIVFLIYDDIKQRILVYDLREISQEILLKLVSLDHGKYCVSKGWPYKLD